MGSLPFLAGSVIQFTRGTLAGLDVQAQRPKTSVAVFSIDAGST